MPQSNQEWRTSAETGDVTAVDPWVGEAAAIQAWHQSGGVAVSPTAIAPGRWMEVLARALVPLHLAAGGREIRGRTECWQILARGDHIPNPTSQPGRQRAEVVLLTPARLQLLGRAGWKS